MADATRKHNIILMTVWMETPNVGEFVGEAGSVARAGGAGGADLLEAGVWKTLKKGLLELGCWRKKIACHFDHSTVPMLRTTQWRR